MFDTHTHETAQDALLLTASVCQNLIDQIQEELEARKLIKYDDEDGNGELKVCKEKHEEIYNIMIGKILECEDAARTSARLLN